MSKEKEMVIEIDGEYTQVFDPELYELKKGFGYRHDGYIYIYRGKIKKQTVLEPGSVYLDENKNPVWVAHSEDTIDLYNEKRCIPLSNDQIYEELLDKSKFKEIDPILLENADDFFAPQILENDDVLKIGTKKVLQQKKIRIKATKNEINTYDITNMKSALTKPSRMSFRYFMKWMELLGVRCKLTLTFEDCEGEISSVDVDF